MTGPIELGLAMSDEALALAEEDPDRGLEHLGYNLLARNLCTRSFLLARAGRLREPPPMPTGRWRSPGSGANQRSSDGRSRCIRSSRSMRASTADESSIAEEAVRVAEETGNVNLQPLVLCALGIAHMNTGEMERRRPRLRAGSRRGTRARRLAVRGREPAHLPVSGVSWAGDHDAAARAADEAVSVSVGRETPVFECGALVRAKPDPKAGRRRGRAARPAPQISNRAVQLIDDTGAEGWRPFVHLEYAELRSASPATMLARGSESSASRSACSRRWERRDTLTVFERNCCGDNSVHSSRST